MHSHHHPTTNIIVLHVQKLPPQSIEFTANSKLFISLNNSLRLILVHDN